MKLPILNGLLLIGALALSNSAYSSQPIMTCEEDQTSLKCKRGITDDELFALLEQNINLKSLDLSDCSNLNKKGHPKPAVNHSDRRVYYEVTSKKSLVEALALVPNLTSLNLDRLKGVSNADIEAIASDHPNLTYLNLDRSYAVSDEGVAAIMKCCLKMNSINLCCTSVNDTALAHIAYMGNGKSPLVSLDLGGCGADISDVGIGFIAEKCNQLTHLDIQACYGIKNEGLALIGKGLPNLTYLNIRATGATDEGLISLAGRFPNMTKLDLSDLKLTDQGISQFIETCPQLKSLLLPNNTAQVMLICLAENCPKLEFLDVSGSKTTDAGIDILMKGCKKLSFLNVPYCMNITDNSLYSIAKYGDQLVSLNISGSEQITVDGILAVLNMCPKLEKIHFSADSQYKIATQMWKSLILKFPLIRIFI